MSGEFFDTNVLVYAYDQSAGPKRQIALELVQRSWLHDNGMLSVQVLQELYVTLLRKTTPRLTPKRARTVVSSFIDWPCFEPRKMDVLRAVYDSGRWGTSLWDGLLLMAANQMRADVLWSEDLSHGQRYGSVVVRNPFLVLSADGNGRGGP